jgi:hypothetical protein
LPYGLPEAGTETTKAKSNDCFSFAYVWLLAK